MLKDWSGICMLKHACVIRKCELGMGAGKGGGLIIITITIMIIIKSLSSS